MADSKRFERDPAEGSRRTVDKQLEKQKRDDGGNHETARVTDKSERRDKPEDALKSDPGFD